jgi:hypothetical protein
MVRETANRAFIQTLRQAGRDLWTERQSGGKKAETLSEGGDTYKQAERRADRRGDGGDAPTTKGDVQTGRETRRLAENTCRQAVILVEGSDTCRQAVVLADRQ